MSVKSEESLDDKTQIKSEIKEEKHELNENENIKRQEEEEGTEKEVKKEELTEEEEKPKEEDPLIDAFYSEVIYKTKKFANNKLKILKKIKYSPVKRHKTRRFQIELQKRAGSFAEARLDLFQFESVRSASG